MKNEQAGEHLANFRSWFGEPIKRLCDYEHAGAALLLIALPLLERYGRQKVGLRFEDNLSDEFFELLSKTFPPLATKQDAKEFWHSYRNGLLHEVTLSMTKGSKELANASMRRDGPPIDFDSTGHRWVNPFALATEIVALIESDFGVFSEAGHAKPLMKTHPIAPGAMATTAARGPYTGGPRTISFGTGTPKE